MIAKIARYKLKHKIIGTLLCAYTITVMVMVVLTYEAWPYIF